MRRGTGWQIVARSSPLLAVGVILALTVGASLAAPAQNPAAVGPSGASVAASNGNGNDNSSGNDNGNSNGNDNSSGNDNGNSNGNDNSSGNDNGNSNGNDNSNSNGNNNDNGSNVSAQATLSGSSASFSGAGGVVTVQYVSGGNVDVNSEAINLASDAGPAIPAGVAQVEAVSLQLVPVTTPNDVNVTLHYTDAMTAAQAVKGGPLRMFYYAAPLGRWVELPVSQDAAAHTVTVSSVDVSAFAPGLTRLALMG